MKGDQIKNFVTHISVCSTLRKILYVNLKNKSKTQVPCWSQFWKGEAKKNTGSETEISDSVMSRGVRDFVFVVWFCCFLICFKSDLY